MGSPRFAPNLEVPYATDHLHRIRFESPQWLERIKFRDLLHSNQQVAYEYENLKRELALTGYACFRRVQRYEN